MKILFDHPTPFLLGHGGFQIQIEQTAGALKAIGVEIDFLRWWDSRQTGDLIHFFSPASTFYLSQTRARKIPVVMTTLFTDTCNRPDWRLHLQGWLTRCILGFPVGKGITDQLRWKSFRECEFNVVGIEAERKVLQTVYGISDDAISVIPLGLSETYLHAGHGDRKENHLICTGTITERKNSVLLAEMARSAKTPVLFVGKPYHPADPYWKRFEQLIDQCWVKYHSHVESEHEMVALLKSARGYVLLSNYENWCLSAHEAAACGLPLLVPDQKWSRERFGPNASYFPGFQVEGNTASLKEFYQACPSLPAPAVKFYSWTDVAKRLKELYDRVLATSR